MQRRQPCIINWPWLYRLYLEHRLNSRQNNRKIGRAVCYSATALNGCISYDTLNVLNIFPLPDIKLQSPDYLCEGETRTLSAGAGFTSYQWNTGSTSSSISIASTGQYSVMVRDYQECSARASVTINRQIYLPKKFLPADTAICTYEKLNIIPNQLYQNYLCSTGETNAGIQIRRRGKYWLKVTDQHN